MWFKNWHKKSGRCIATTGFFHLRKTREGNGVVLELRTHDLANCGKRMIVVFPPEDAWRLAEEIKSLGLTPP